MTHDQIKNGLVQLGFNGGWVLTGDKITLWENSEPEPTEIEILKAAEIYKKAQDKKAAEAITAKTAIAERLGLSPEELATLLA
jgi:MOSC domain-containing protein YiiM